MQSTLTNWVCPWAQVVEVSNVGSIVARVGTATVYDNRIELVRYLLSPSSFPLFSRFVAMTTAAVRCHVQFQWKFKLTRILQRRNFVTATNNTFVITVTHLVSLSPLEIVQETQECKGQHWGKFPQTTFLSKSHDFKTSHLTFTWLMHAYSTEILLYQGQAYDSV